MEKRKKRMEVETHTEAAGFQRQVVKAMLDERSELRGHVNA
jgi:hypothetical protein